MSADLPSRVRASACASHEAGQAPAVREIEGELPTALRQVMRSVLPRPGGSLGEEVVDLPRGELTEEEWVEVADALRYRFLRELDPSAFADLVAEHRRGNRTFDSLVDAAIAAQRGVRT